MKKSYKITPQTRILGLGDMGEFINKRGQVITLMNRDEYPYYRAIPLVITGVGGDFDGYFINSAEKLIFDLDSRGQGEWSVERSGADELDIRHFHGSLSEIIEQYTAVTGRMKMPPDWALGFAQSRYSYQTEAEVLEVVEGFRAREIPLSAVYLDIHYMKKYRVFSWDKKRFPNPAAMIKKLDEMGVKVVAVIDPNIPARYAREIPKIAARGNAWAGRVAYPDFEDAKTRQWWAKQIKENLLDFGVAGIWNDMNEPADLVRKEKTAPVKHHNAYALGVARAAAESGAEFVLSRAAFAGSQRYTAIWTGDNASSWADLAASIYMCLNLGICGISFCGADAGGFFKDATPELYARWMQLGSFMPFFRAHSDIDSRRHEPWCFGDEVEKIAVKYIKLRYEMMDYIKEELAESCRTGLPLMRAMALDFPHDERVWGLSHQYMFGRKYLVAPVIFPEQRVQNVYLPAGKWRNFWTNEIANSKGEFVVTPAELDTIPIYERAE
ncbi:MAG: glycoside hydrolase family 31 protein [Clostridiales bacterium]|jgi:alpha-glucosidase|nr:glycoside hydrolase family 31 protein [Clostridiales bacterium]